MLAPKVAIMRDCDYPKELCCQQPEIDRASGRSGFGQWRWCSTPSNVQKQGPLALVHSLLLTTKAPKRRCGRRSTDLTPEKRTPC
jgi:hypothetical protein